MSDLSVTDVYFDSGRGNWVVEYGGPDKARTGEERQPMTSDRDQLAELAELLFPHMSGSGLGKDTVGYDMAQYEASRLARIVVAAGWRPPDEHIHDWHSTPNYVWCQCGAERRVNGERAS